ETSVVMWVDGSPSSRMPTIDPALSSVQSGRSPPVAHGRDRRHARSVVARAGGGPSLKARRAGHELALDRSITGALRGELDPFPCARIVAGPTHAARGVARVHEQGRVDGRRGGARAGAAGFLVNTWACPPASPPSRSPIACAISSGCSCWASCAWPPPT